MLLEPRGTHSSGFLGPEDKKYLPPSPTLSLSLVVLEKYGCYSRVIKHYVKDPKKLRAVPSFDK